MGKTTKKSKTKYCDVGKRLSTLRKAKKLTQQELANSINVTRQIISAWENGNVEIPVGRMLQLCKTLGVETDYFYAEQRFNPEMYFWIHDNISILLKIVEQTDTANDKDKIKKIIYEVISNLEKISTLKTKSDSVYASPIVALEAINNYIRMIKSDMCRKEEINSKIEQMHKREMNIIEMLSLSENLTIEEAGEVELLFKDGRKWKKIKDMPLNILKNFYNIKGYELLDANSFEALAIYLKQNSNLQYPSLADK